MKYRNDKVTMRTGSILRRVLCEENLSRLNKSVLEWSYDIVNLANTWTFKNVYTFCVGSPATRINTLLYACMPS